MQVIDYGQSLCYKCGSKARVRAVRHYVLNEVYGVCCTNPDCRAATNRNYVYRTSAVNAWNRKPTVCDLVVDRIFDKFDAFFEKRFEKERED